MDPRQKAQINIRTAMQLIVKGHRQMDVVTQDDIDGLDEAFQNTKAMVVQEAEARKKAREEAAAKKKAKEAEKAKAEKPKVTEPPVEE